MKDQTAPNPSAAEKMDKAFFGHPKPLSSMFMTELWERFSYYGLRAILVLFLKATLDDDGMGMSETEATSVVGVFAGCIYLSTLPGGWLADRWLGQVKSVYYGAALIALGNACIAFSGFYNPIFFVGLALIVCGSGLFKTCISVMVGSLYKPNDARRDGGFSLFYMGVNIGAFIAPIVIGSVQTKYGWRVGFGFSAIGMIISLIIFRLVSMPRLRQFDEIRNEKSDWNHAVMPTKGVARWVILFFALLAALFVLAINNVITINPVAIASSMTVITMGAIIVYFFYMFFGYGFGYNERIRLVICLILLFASAVFWAAYEQMPTTMNIFADKYTDRMIGSWEIPTPFFQSIGALFVVMLAPFFSWFWGFLGRKNLTPTSFTQFSVALLLAAAAFFIMKTGSDIVVDNPGTKVSPAWLTVNYFVITLGELCLSPVGLATMTILAPTKVRGQMMGLWYCATALGNVVAGLLAGSIDHNNINTVPELFLKCTIVLIIAGIIIFSMNFFFGKQIRAIRSGQQD